MSDEIVLHDQTTETWVPTKEIVWADDGSATPWLAQVWRCRENGKMDLKPLPTVKLPLPTQL